MATLRFESGPYEGLECELKQGSNFLGRDPANDFVIDDCTISSRHCEVVVTDFSVRARDLGSTNGTFVDDLMVKEAELKDGQALTLGDVRMRVEIPPVHIAIPPLPEPESRVVAPLPNGSPACFNHPGVAAARACVQCQRTFCEECVRVLRLMGGKSRFFCPACSGVCKIIQPAKKAAPRSLVGRLLDTIRIRLRGGRTPKAAEDPDLTNGQGPQGG